MFAPADVCDEAEVQAAVDAASALGTLRVAVNCAGVATPDRLLGRHGVLALDAFRAVVEANLVGTFNVLRLAAARMVENEPSTGTAAWSSSPPAWLPSTLKSARWPTPPARAASWPSPLAQPATSPTGPSG